MLCSGNEDISRLKTLEEGRAQSMLRMWKWQIEEEALDPPGDKF